MEGNPLPGILLAQRKSDMANPTLSDSAVIYPHSPMESMDMGTGMGMGMGVGYKHGHGYWHGVQP